MQSLSVFKKGQDDGRDDFYTHRFFYTALLQIHVHKRVGANFIHDILQHGKETRNSTAG